jgi:hypothetical protein
MSSDAVIELVRVGWLILAFMMLLSRAVFQAVGPLGVRAFLDSWQSGSVKRYWGALGLVYGCFVGVAGVLALGDLSATDTILLVGLLVILLADGILNLLPAGFETFKTKVQDAWVTRYRGTRRATDRSLFGVLNALLALAAGAVAAAVMFYRPIEGRTVLVAAAVAVVLTFLLIGASDRGRQAVRTRS